MITSAHPRVEGGGRFVPYAVPVTRRRITLTLSVTAGILVLVLVAVTIFTAWSIRRPFPAYDGAVEIPRLSADVDIIRDEHGIAHIYADTAEDLFRAQGYVHAQDRFWEMDFRRHVTSGRIAELFGEDHVETDAFVRTMGWRQVARQEFPLLAPETRRYLQSYADGVNAWLRENSGADRGFAYTLLGLIGGDTTPARWSPIDSLSWLKAMAWDLRGNVVDEVDRALLSSALPVERVEQLYPDYDPEVGPPIVDDEYLPDDVPDTIIGRDGEPVPVEETGAALRSAAAALRAAPVMLGSGSGVGSNAWVVDGTLTESGAPLLANDPHLSPTLPSIWYQVGLHCRQVGPECPFDVAGFSFSGLPGVVIGHNQDVAWGFTNLGADVIDLYLEDVEGDTYRVHDELVPMETREETIHVAGGDEVTITVRSTRHGPLISDHSEQMREVGFEAPVAGDAPDRGDGYGVALRWTALDPGLTADAVFALNAASDWSSFRAAAALFEVPSQNLVYADVEGNIGYQAPGKIPVRAGGDGRYPVPGWTDEYDWAGYIPFDDLPSMLNPDDGMIVTANQPVTSDAYPFLLTADFDLGHRAGRIGELLEEAVADGPLDVETMTRIQMDTYSAAAEVLVPHLLKLDAPAGYYGDGLRLLRDWDYLQEPESGAAAYFNTVWSRVLALTFHDELPEDQWPSGGGRWFETMRDLLESPDDPFWDDVATDEVERREDILARAVLEARDEMTRLQGKDPEMWEWGRAHTLSLTDQTFGDSGIGLVESLFNMDPEPVGGGSSTVQANAWNAAEGYEVTWVPSMRMVVDLADLDGSMWVDLTGVSGHPFHRNYGDQNDLWRSGEMLPMRWSEESVRAAGDYHLVLRPSQPISGAGRTE
ncbi:penicillin acylase family protein [Phytoactinopolyspora alkaliphila]|uniref:Penicillin acylase family protein n=1 Tax=Phytoactinopolyspora alkaliphila TaxID=1783498 RepID=A0A6N9YI18_9ACTN|nr:penicillin acylase family protein [Phytoactinopolyspora alkaliphila]NED94646.1 penicillin acylase family protein [Phytoactinopolyspora alkaliphila]